MTSIVSRPEPRRVVPSRGVSSDGTPVSVTLASRAMTAATAAMPKALRDYDPTQPGNLLQQVIADSKWWADNFDKARAEFADMLQRA